MNKARQVIREVLSGARYPALLWSGGKDSMLLLALVREVKNIPCIWFRMGLSREQERFARRIILEWDLEVWSWWPSDVYLVPNNEGLTLIREQAFGPARLPVLLDVEEGANCIFDFPQERTVELYPHFDHVFIGYRGEDYHHALGRNFCPADGWSLGNTKFYAPLREMKEAEVWQAIKELNVPYDTERYEGSGLDPDVYHACTKCLYGERVFCPKEQRMIESVDWNPGLSLSSFHQRFGFQRSN